MQDTPLARLRAVLAESGLSQNELARTLGRDERTIRRWLSEEAATPESVGRMLEKLERLDVDKERVTVVLRR